MSVQAQPSQASQGGQGQQAQYLDDSTILARINEALKIIHYPYSQNDQRREALAFLEDVKTIPLAPSHGYTLAIDPNSAPTIRHYGLSLLEHSIKHRWHDYPDAQHVTLRQWVLGLAEKVSLQDPPYIRNKISQLWVEVAKRSWAQEWMDMDQLLVQIWNSQDSVVHKELVLSILEMLSEEIFNGDDSVVEVRDGVLSKACVEIFTPAAVLTEAFPKRTAGPDVRCESEGWISRITTLLGQCLESDLQNNEGIRTCAIRALSVFYSIMPWAIPKAIIACSCVPTLCNGLASSHVAVQKAALEAVHALYSRTNFHGEEFVDLVVPLYHQDFIDLCRRLFDWSRVDADDIDEDKYQFSKKFSELMSCLGNYMDRRYKALPESVDKNAFFELLLLVVQSPSLVVSIPVLVTWTRLLSSEQLGPEIARTPIVGPLLEVCSSRLLRYESLPEDTNDQTYLFLVEDTDTLPERHAFLGNYRRYSTQVIEAIVQLQLTGAMTHVVGQTEKVLQNLYDGLPSFSPVNYSKSSMPALRVDAQCTVLESALKGYVKWRAEQEQTEATLQERATLESNLETWCNRLLEMGFDDPAIRKRILQLLVAFSTTVLDRKPPFMFKVLEHILMTWPGSHPEHKMYNEAIKDLQSESMIELQRLASKMPDHLLDVYDQLEAKIKEMVSSGSVEEKRQVAYQSFLFIIIHRSTRLNTATKVERLRGFVEPVQALWQDESLQQAISSYDSFVQLMALDKAQRYIMSRRMNDIKDWGNQPLDEEGLTLQAELEERQTRLPLRSTKTFLTYSVEKIEKNSDKYEATVALWKDSFPVILRNLLQFLTHAHATHNAENWSGLTPETRPVVSRVLTDRFWQAGISEGSKDDFYARVMDKKGTLEGLASTIRGAVRFVRETSYAIIYCMTRLDLQFYGFEELPRPLAHALFADSFCLSSHQLINIINLLRYLVDNCPVRLREHFLPPLLAMGFQQIDTKVNSEWEALHASQEVQASRDDLTEEMKAESILRQLTYAAVLMLADLLDPARPTYQESLPYQETSSYQGSLAPRGRRMLTTSQDWSDGPNSKNPPARKFPSLRKFCLMQSAIVEPLLMFCTHAIRMRDTRCCSVVLRVFRSIVPEFHVDSSNAPPSNGTSWDMTEDVKELNTPIPAEVAHPIREFVSSEVLKACITSLHEPYFVDLQKDLGALIASIIIHYHDLTETPIQVLLSLPNMRPEDVKETVGRLVSPGLHSRQQRALVLELLKDLKGVSISEMGKLDKTPRQQKRHGRSKMVQEFMTALPPQPRAPGTVATADGDGSAIESVAGLFEQH
ncbi:uncharacterized protein MKZ38_005699 [Zalerion maritima]|uniref:Importin N-terminal domain-containing protein n=1 Tax=Zalerion maritima TaxID=339359 RepID=A0AAD5RL25_9PEZI|nr:uncharacterized protein MKZ38_005699 [Zalerion maritima]